MKPAVGRRACLAFVVHALLLSQVCTAGGALAQSGYQTIQGTRVFTEVFQSQGYARFSNECGSQTLTQGQLQAGAIPSNIIPCPRGGSAPPRPGSGDSREICTDGSRCPSGHLCMRNNRCVPLSSERYCGGRSYCEQGFACAEAGKCIALTSERYCGNKRYCSEGAVCAEEGKCISATSERYCGNKRYCAPGSACAEEGKCIATTSERYCGNKRYCNPGFACAEEGKCISTASERYCGGGKYCAEGSACAEEGQCLSVKSARYCGNKRYCQPGFACTDGTTCTQVATPATPPNDGAACERDNKANVDWVVAADKGARDRFDGFRAAGRSDFEAVVAAQAHNPPVQASLRRCKDWVSAYLATRGFANGSGTPKAQAGKPPDCRCVSVVPTGADRGPNLGREYNVTNACGRMGISVKLQDKSNTTLSTWINVGDLDLGGSRLISAPQAYGISSINAVEVRGQSASQVCSFF